MIFDASEYVEEVFSHDDVKAVLGEKVYWELAPKNPVLPWAAYHIESDGPVTKDRLVSYNLQLLIFGKTMREAASIAKQIGNSVFERQLGWRLRGEKSGYVDTEAKEGYIEMSYNFKI